MIKLNLKAKLVYFLCRWLYNSSEEGSRVHCSRFDWLWGINSIIIIKEISDVRCNDCQRPICSLYSLRVVIKFLVTCTLDLHPCNKLVTLWVNCIWSREGNFTCKIKGLSSILRHNGCYRLLPLMTALQSSCKGDISVDTVPLSSQWQAVCGVDFQNLSYFSSVVRHNYMYLYCKCILQ